MFKKLLSTLLTALLIATALPILGLTSLAADSTGSTDAGEGNGADAIANAFDATHLVVTNDLDDDGKVGIPVTIKTYADKTLYSELGASEDTAMPTTASGRKYEVIVYIIGHNEERIGQESDVSILTDYLGQGYVVVVLDYKYHDLAIASQLEFSIQNIRKQIQTNGTYLGDDLKANRPSIKKDCNFALPAGCRLARNIVYYNLLENGIAGTAEQIVKCWNDAGTSSNTFKNAKTSKIPACEYNNNTKGVWYEATSVEQLVRPDPVTGEAIPLDFNLYLDLVYPSNPTRETPVYMNSSSHEQREGEGVGNGGILQTGLALRGYTTGIYDHEYFPMARDDHYGYFIGSYGYGMAAQIGVKTHSAAIRCVRYHAAEFGYSEYDGYSVGGGSKASYCSILGSDEPNDRAEISSFSGDSFNTTDYATAGQPWLTYSDESANAGEKISARVEGVISFMGDGTNRHAEIVNADTSASVIACGIYDQFGSWDKWPAAQATYMSYDVPHLAMSMYDLGHAWPVGVDSVLKYDRSQAMIEFLYYWANTEDVAPRVIYTSPHNGDDGNKNEDPIVIHFAGNIPLTEIQNKVTVIDTSNNNQVLTGTWTASAGNNKFEFVANEEFVNGHTYQLSIPATVTDSRGLSMEKAVTTTFVSAADVKVPAIKDAYIVSGSSVNTGSESTVKLSGSTSRGYLEFDISSIKESTILTRLSINVENDATNSVQVWALAEDAATWSEDTIVWDNAPEASTLIGTISVTGAGEYKLDITDYVAALEGNTVRLVLINKFNSAEVVYDQSFDDVTSFVKGTNSDAVGSYSETYDYRQGGAPASFSISSDEDHTTGSGKSFVMVRKNNYDRFKLYNTIKSSALTEDDIGKTFRATFWVKTDADITVTAGLMMPQGTYGTTFCGTTSTTKVSANTWTECELIITLTEEHVTNQAAMLTVQGTGTSALYVDDVHVETMATDVVISSSEGSSAPTVLANTNKGVVAIGKVQYETFDAAMQAVPTDGTATTITLQEDVTLTGGISVTAGMNLTIDLGGYTLTLNNASNISNFTAPVGVTGSLKIGNGNFVCTGSTQYTFHVWGSGTDNGSYLEFMDGLNIDSDAAYGIVQVGKQTANEGSFVMRDGVTVKTVYLLIYTYSGSNATIYGGDVENTVGPMIFCFQGSNEKVIWGGTYKSVPGDLQLFRQVSGLVLKGGTYSEYAGDRNGNKAKIADGYVLVENTDGTYSVKEAEAKIGTTSYLTFADALAAVPTDGTATTITLFRDVTLSAGFTVASGMDLTIDLGGHTMSGKNLALVSGATAPIAVRGSLTLKNGTLDISTTATSGYYGIHVFGTSSATTAYLELEDGFTFKAVVGSGAIQLGNNTYLGSFISNEGVSVDTSRYLVYAYGSCPMTIYGGTYEDTKQGRLLYLSGTAERTIYGGTFISNPTDDSDKKLFALTGGLMLMGGTYNELPADSLIDEDHEIIDNGDGTYTVREIPRGLMIGDTNYATIEAAMAAVPTDGTATTITLLDNVTTTSGFLVKAGMNLTVDLAGYTFTVSGTAQPSGHYASIGVKGVLKIGNGTLVIDGAKQYGIHVYNTGTDSGAMMELLDGLTLKMINSVDTHGMIQLGNQTSNSGEMIIHEGVTVLGEYRLFYAYTNSTFTIYGGHFENSKVTEMFYNIGSTKRVIYGGTFSTPAGASTYKLFRQGHGLVLYGGTYSEQPLAANAGVPTLGEDRQVVENSDGTYTIEKIHYVGEPVDFTYVSQAEPDKNFGGEKNVVLSGENGKNMMILAEFNIADLANMEFFRIPVCGDADQKISVAVIDGWSFDPTTVTYNNVQDKLWAELMTTEKAGKHIGRYTVGTTALTINADDILSKVTGDVFTLVLQADEKYVFSLDFNDRTEMTISEGATHGVIGNTNTLNVPYETTYMAARGGYTKGCTINFVSATDKNGQSSMMFRVTQGGQRYRFYNLLAADNLTVLDIGHQFRISFDVMTTVDTSNMLNAGLHCRLSGDGVTSPTSGGTDNQYANYAGNWRYYDNTISTTANTWTTVSFDIIIDETMVNHQIGMLCLNFGNIGSTEYFYIDNIKAEEISGNASATSVSFKSDFPVAFVDDQQITLGDKVTIIETNVKIGELDTDATTTKLIADGNNVLLAVDNKTGNLFFKKDGTSYVLCDAKGNAYTVSSDSLPVAAIIDKAAGTVRYAVGGKLAYYLDGGVAVNTYGTVIASSGFGATVTAGALGNAHGAVDAANTTSSTMTTDTPFIVGSQMSTVNNSVRVLSGINSLYYSEIGFRAVRGDGTVKEWKTAVVFTSVNALGESETAESLGCKYLSGFIVNGLEEAVGGDIFTVTPLVYIGEQEIAGDTVTFTVAVENGMISVTSGN